MNFFSNVHANFDIIAEDDRDIWRTKLAGTRLKYKYLDRFLHERGVLTTSGEFDPEWLEWRQKWFRHHDDSQVGDQEASESLFPQIDRKFDMRFRNRGTVAPLYKNILVRAILGLLHKVWSLACGPSGYLLLCSSLGGSGIFAL